MLLRRAALRLLVVDTTRVLAGAAQRPAAGAACVPRAPTVVTARRRLRVAGDAAALPVHGAALDSVVEVALAALVPWTARVCFWAAGVATRAVTHASNPTHTAQLTSSSQCRRHSGNSSPLLEVSPVHVTCQAAFENINTAVTRTGMGSCLVTRTETRCECWLTIDWAKAVQCGCWLSMGWVMAVRCACW